jgi:F0F1-type ATP synthase assembly protein I
MEMERIGYILLGIVALCWLVAVIVGMVAALPWGIIGFIALLGFGLLFAKVLRERLASEEDDRYSRHVDQ